MYTYRLVGLVFRALCSLLPVWDRHTFSLNFWSSCLHFPTDRIIGCQLQPWMVLRNIKIFSPKKLLLFIYFYWPESSITVIPCSKQCGIVAWYVVKFIAWSLKTMTSHHWASWWYFLVCTVGIPGLPEGLLWDLCWVMHMIKTCFLNIFLLLWCPL